jgi:lipopolysaccharide transport system ATP-binding protein
MSTIISVEGVSKKYRIEHRASEKYQSLRDVIADSGRRFVRRLSKPLRTGQVSRTVREEFWALKDINFEVARGERVGIIGRNGAGKSTLLKILSRITEPSTGKVRIWGRVASMLEVGTGFHPELTGRENVFLNGAIQGMSRREITRKFDDIVAFAEVEKFLDTPVKRYSSGMYVRLAFAVAAHLDPELLIVDEVLAVGDIQFQKKCLAKMEDVAADGRTILLVSHNMATILSLANRCILLASGSICRQGVPQEVISEYQATYQDQSLGQTDLGNVERYGTGQARFVSIHLRAHSRGGNPVPYPETGCDLHFEVVIEAYEDVRSATAALILYDELGNRLIDANTLLKGQSVSLKPGERKTVRFQLKNVRLKRDTYTVGLWLGALNVADIDGIRYATSFKIEALRDDILYSAPFPGVYACEFTCDVLEAV